MILAKAFRCLNILIGSARFVTVHFVMKRIDIWEFFCHHWKLLAKHPKIGYILYDPAMIDRGMNLLDNPFIIDKANEARDDRCAIILTKILSLDQKNNVKFISNDNFEDFKFHSKYGTSANRFTSSDILLPFESSDIPDDMGYGYEQICFDFVQDGSDIKMVEVHY